MPEDNIYTLDGKLVPVAPKTNPVIIEMLEEALACAKAGQMMACAIATVMADARLAGTVFHSEAGYHTDLLGTALILQHRMLDMVDKG